MEEKRYLSDSTYNLIKKLVQLVLPALGSLYFGLAAIWGLPAAEQVVGTFALLATFFGVLLEISSRSYNASDSKYDGDIVVTEMDGGSKLYSLELKGDPTEIDSQKELLFKVKAS